VGVHNLATNETRPPLQAAVNYDFIGRGERIRTSDLSVPNRALYQAEPRPETNRVGFYVTAEALSNLSNFLSGIL
jgi:hypothetical protein